MEDVVDVSEPTSAATLVSASQPEAGQVPALQPEPPVPATEATAVLLPNSPSAMLPSESWVCQRVPTMEPEPPAAAPDATTAPAAPLPSSPSAMTQPMESWVCPRHLGCGRIFAHRADLVAHLTQSGHAPYLHKFAYRCPNCLVTFRKWKMCRLHLISSGHGDLAATTWLHASWFSAQGPC